MNRFYILIGLLGVLGMIAGGIVFFSPQYRVAHYASQLEHDMEDHPASQLLALVFPDKTERAALSSAAADVWLAHGYAAAIYKIELTLLHRATPLVAKSMPYASDAAVNNYMQLTYRALDRLADIDPESCGVLTGHAPEGAVTDANMALINVMSEEEKRTFFAALTDIIVSAKRNPEHISLNLNQVYTFIHQAMEEAVEKMGKERAAASVTGEPEKPYDPCLIQSYILGNLLEVEDAYRTDVFKIQMLRGTAKRLKDSTPPPDPVDTPPGDEAPVVRP